MVLVDFWIVVVGAVAFGQELPVEPRCGSSTEGGGLDPRVRFATLGFGMHFLELGVATIGNAWRRRIATAQCEAG